MATRNGIAKRREAPLRTHFYLGAENVLNLTDGAQRLPRRWFRYLHQDEEFPLACQWPTFSWLSFVA